MSELLAELRHEGLCRLYDYWRGKCGTRTFPSRRDIDPLDFRYVLGNVILLEVLSDPLRFRFRLMGANLTQRAGYDLTGKLIDDIPDTERRAFAKAFYGSVVEARQPRAAARERQFDGAVWRSEFVAMPLAADGEHIDMLLVGNVFTGGG